MNIPEVAKLLSSLPPNQRIQVANALAQKGKADALERFDLKVALFDKQIEVIENPSRKKVIVCSRRSGKSYLVAAALLYKALKHSNTTSLYLGLTKKDAKNVLDEALLIKGLSLETNQLACQYFLDTALQIGANDNVSAVVLRAVPWSSP